MSRKTAKAAFVLCIRNEGYAASLEVRKVYPALPDDAASAHRLVRVIDESGEDYLYPQGFFVPVELPPRGRKAVLAAQ